MIRYLLDTDSLSYLLKPNYPYLHRRVAELSFGDFGISAISYAETLYGLEALPAGHPVRDTSNDFLVSVQILPWPIEASPIYAQIRYRLERSGKMIGDRDVMIAAHAIATDATLVTNNTRHLSRIEPPLRLENWVRPSGPFLIKPE